MKNFVFLHNFYGEFFYSLCKNFIGNCVSDVCCSFRQDLKIYHRGTESQRFFMFFSAPLRLCGENSPEN